MDTSDSQNPVLDIGESHRKVPDLYFKVVDPKLQVADLKAEMRELRSGEIPNLTPDNKCDCDSAHTQSQHVRTNATWFLAIHCPIIVVIFCLSSVCLCVCR